MLLRFTLRSSVAVLAATIAAALSGCATGGNFGNGTTSAATALTAGLIGGKVHGGNQPIVGAAVTLWAAGSATAGGAYGKGAVSVATATTDVNGAFNFDNASGVSPCTVGQYLYITAAGGNTGAGLNPYSALMAALPTPCSSTTGATYVWINEVTTVAAVWSLQQFMSINPAGNGTTTPYWQIGAPGSNVTGMGNAFAQTAQLASIATGVSQATNATSTVSSVVYTTTITPDTARINMLADILADCVNTAGTSVCTSLFSDATPSNATAPGDTIQAAYYLATNPAGLTMPVGTAANAPTNLCNTFVTSTPPFPTSLVCGTNTNDWLVGVNWKAVNASGTTVGTLYAASVAIDHSGNIWTGAGSGATANYINEFNQTGQVILNPVNTANIPAYNVNYVVTGTGTSSAYPGSTGYALGYGRPFSLAIDTNNNAWFNSYSSTSPGTLSNTLLSGVLAEVTPGNQTGAATGYIVGSANGAIAIDGSNNIYMNDIPTSGRYYLSELTAASSYQTFDEGTGRSTGIYNSVFVDDSISQYAWALNSPTTCTIPATIDRANSAMEASGTSTVSITDTANCAGYGAPDAAGNAWVTYGGNLYYINIGTSITAPTITTVSGTTNASATGNGGTGGLDNPTGVAVDGAGNVWVINRLSGSAIGGLSEFTPTTTSGTTTVVAQSEGGSATTQAGEFGFQTFGVTGPQGVQIDSSGNLWINGTSGSYLYHMVGAAAPVVTPTALAIANTALGAKP